MKNKAKYIAITVLLIIAFYIWQVYNAAKTLSFAFGKITGIKFANGTIECLLYLKTTNGEATAIPLTGINIDNYFGNSIIGKAILEQTVFISGRATTDIPIRIIIPFTDLLLLIPEILNSIHTKKVAFALRGNVSAIGITVPINQPFVLDLNSIL